MALSFALQHGFRHNHEGVNSVRTTLLLLVASAFLSGFQEKEKSDRPLKRGDTVLVTGCVSRGRIESNDMKAADREVTYDRLVTYRLTGDKKVLESLKKEHEGHVETLTAVLKSELPIDDYRRIGNTNIGIGLPGRNQPPTPSYPVLEVKSTEHTGKTCEQ